MHWFEVSYFCFCSNTSNSRAFYCCLIQLWLGTIQLLYFNHYNYYFKNSIMEFSFLCNKHHEIHFLFIFTLNFIGFDLTTISPNCEKFIANIFTENWVSYSYCFVNWWRKVRSMRVRAKMCSDYHLRWDTHSHTLVQIVLFGVDFFLFAARLLLNTCMKIFRSKNIPNVLLCANYRSVFLLFYTKIEMKFKLMRHERECMTNR